MVHKWYKYGVRLQQAGSVLGRVHWPFSLCEQSDHEVLGIQNLTRGIIKLTDLVFWARGWCGVGEVDLRALFFPPLVCFDVGRRAPVSLRSSCVRELVLRAWREGGSAARGSSCCCSGVGSVGGSSGGALLWWVHKQREE